MMTSETVKESPAVPIAPPSAGGPAPARPRRWRWIVPVVLVLVGAAGMAAWWRAHPAVAPTIAVERRTLDDVVEVSGSVESARAVTIKAEAGGQVLARPVGEGRRARAGETLLQLDPASARLQLAQARANAAASAQQTATQLENAGRSLREVTDRQGVTLADARNQVEKAKSQVDFLASELARSEALLVDGAIAIQTRDAQRQQLEQARRDLAAARANLQRVTSGQELLAARNAVEQARTAADTARSQGVAAVALAEKALADTTVRAPFAGTLTSWNVNAGDWVTPGLPLAVYQDLDHLRFTLPVDELDLPKMRVGGPVEIALDAYPELAVHGTIAEIGRASQLTGGNVPVFPVKVAFTNPTGAIRPGMSGEARVLARRKPNVLALPLGAVRREGGKYLVTVVTGRRETPREIVPGITTLEYVEVKSGLTAGERVLYAGTLATPSQAPSK